MNVKVIIDLEKCTSCPNLICVDICPRGIFHVGPNGKPQISDSVSCTTCCLCENLCPSKAIKVERKSFSRE